MSPPREVPGYETAGEALGRAMARPFSEYPDEIRAAVDAYDERRREGLHEGPMSDANKAHIAPMIFAACRAYIEMTVERLS
jgi:hypothetical protein